MGVYEESSGVYALSPIGDLNDDQVSFCGQEILPNVGGGIIDLLIGQHCSLLTLATTLTVLLHK